MRKASAAGAWPFLVPPITHYDETNPRCQAELHRIRPFGILIRVYCHHHPFGAGLELTDMSFPPKFVVLTALAAGIACAQVSSNASLTGKYYFRQVLLTTDGTANVTATHSASGTLTFDGNGNFTISGQVLAGTTAPANLSPPPGTYTVKPG